MTAVEATPSQPPLNFVKRPSEEKRRLLKKLIAPLLPTMDDTQGGRFILEAATLLAPYEPKLALDLAERVEHAHQVDLFLAMDAIDEAFEVAASIDDPYRKTYQLVQVADAADPKNSQRPRTGVAERER